MLLLVLLRLARFSKLSALLLCSQAHTYRHRFCEKAMTKGEYVDKGEELGLFKFGGSTVTVAFEKDRIQFDWDLEHWSQGQIMVDVEVGMSMGSATTPEGKKQVKA